MGNATTGLFANSGNASGVAVFQGTQITLDNRTSRCDVCREQAVVYTSQETSREDTALPIQIGMTYKKSYYVAGTALLQEWALIHLTLVIQPVTREFSTSWAASTM
jgi:hypothetical protein